MNVARLRLAENRAFVNVGECAWTKRSGLKIRCQVP